MSDKEPKDKKTFDNVEVTVEIDPELYLAIELYAEMVKTDVPTLIKEMMVREAQTVKSAINALPFVNYNKAMKRYDMRCKDCVKEE